MQLVAKCLICEHVTVETIITFITARAGCHIFSVITLNHCKMNHKSRINCIHGSYFLIFSRWVVCLASLGSFQDTWFIIALNPVFKKNNPGLVFHLNSWAWLFDFSKLPWSDYSAKFALITINNSDRIQYFNTIVTVIYRTN